MVVERERERERGGEGRERALLGVDMPLGYLAAIADSNGILAWPNHKRGPVWRLKV